MPECTECNEEKTEDEIHGYYRGYAPICGVCLKRVYAKMEKAAGKYLEEREKENKKFEDPEEKIPF